MFFRVRELQGTFLFLALWSFQSSYCIPVDNLPELPQIQPSEILIEQPRAEPAQIQPSEIQLEQPRAEPPQIPPSEIQFEQSRAEPAQEPNANLPVETPCPAGFNPQSPYTMAISVVNSVYCSISANSSTLNERLSETLNVQTLNALAGNPIVTTLISQVVDAGELLLNALLEHPIATAGFNKTLDVLIVNMRSMMSNKYIRRWYRTFLHTLQDTYRQSMYQNNNYHNHNHNSKPNNNNNNHNHNHNHNKHPPKNSASGSKYDSLSDYLSNSNSMNETDSSSSSSSQFRSTPPPNGHKRPKHTSRKLTDDSMSMQGNQGFDPLKFGIDVLKKLGKNFEQHDSSEKSPELLGKGEIYIENNSETNLNSDDILGKTPEIPEEEMGDMKW